MAFRITEKKRIKIRHECVDLPVYLAWYNIEGGLSYWLFGFNQTESLIVKEGSSYVRFIDDLENADTKEELIQKFANKSFQMGADNLDSDDITVLEGLLMSTKVQLLRNIDTWEQEGPKWVTVKVRQGTFKLKETRLNISNLQFSIGFPSINIPTN